MLPKITIGCAVVVAMLAAPPTMPAHSMGGMHSMGGIGSMHSMGGMGSMHSMGGMHTSHTVGNPSMASSWGGWHHHFAHFHHFHHFRHRFLFATAIGVGYNSCWRWVPTRFGWHRVWICGPYY
jgi:hypothetical protein